LAIAVPKLRLCRAYSAALDLPPKLRGHVKAIVFDGIAHGQAGKTWISNV
jgi:hypothetical protein